MPARQVVCVGFGNAYLTYPGIPGANYALDITHTLPANNWSPVITNIAASNGFLNFTIPISLSPTNDYYRTRYVPLTILGGLAAQKVEPVQAVDWEQIAVRKLEHSGSR